MTTTPPPSARRPLAQDAVTPPQPDPRPDARRPGVRLVVADMDGTLLDSGGRIPEGLWPLLDRMRERGVVFVPASGRQHARLARMFERAIDGMPIIADNGSYVVLDGQELHSTTLERDVAVDLVHRVRAAGRRQLVLTVSGKRCAYVECADEAFLAECRKYYSRLEILPDLLDFDDEVLKLALFDPESVTRFAEPLIADLAGSHHTATSGRYWLDIAAKGTNKGAALRRLQDRLAVPPEQTAAFGDYLNDMEMLQAAGRSFAVADAHPQILAVAQCRIPSCGQDVVDAIGRLLARG